MKKSIIRLTTFSFLLMFLVSCNKDELTLKVDSLMPINSGNSWTYKYTYFNGNMENIDTTVITVGDKVTINGYACFAFIDESPYSAKFVASNDEYGNVVTYGGYSDVDTLVTPSIEFKKNAKLGDEWDYSMISMDWDSGQFSETVTPVKCISTDTLISTPKGEFHCMAFEISINSGNHIFRHYLSANVGQVKTEHYEDNYLFSYSELIDYQLN